MRYSWHRRPPAILRWRRWKGVGSRARLLLLAALLAASVARSVEAEDDGSGVWHGNYTCGQGSTGLTLTIDPVHAEDRPSNAVRGLFEFYALQSNAGVPDGCFEMSGTVDPATTQVELTATRWLLHPPGYVTVNLSGHISHGQTMTGAVVGPSCTQFALRRIAPPRAAVTIPCRSNDTIASAR